MCLKHVLWWIGRFYPSNINQSTLRAGGFVQSVDTLWLMSPPLTVRANIEWYGARVQPILNTFPDPVSHFMAEAITPPPSGQYSPEFIVRGLKGREAKFADQRIWNRCAM